MTRAPRPWLHTSPPSPSHTGGEWRNQAACLGHPTLPASTWDDTAPGEGAGHSATREARIHRAKNVCRTCPVKAECATDVDLDYDEGVRGGEDLRDVRAARNKAQKAQAS